MKPRVLVGIVTRNRAEILSKALASVCAQQYPSLRVAVVDNGSTDGTNALADRFPKVLWTRWGDNRGYMAARNHFMATADASYFVSLDDDARFVDCDEIAVAVDYLERHPGVAAAAFDILSPDRPDPVSRIEPTQAAMFIGCGHVLRLTAIQKVGGYESVPGSYGGEEKDLCLRLLDAGFEIVKLPGVHVWHAKSSLSREIPAQHRSGVCNDLVMTFRRTPVALLPVALVAKFCRHSVFALKHGLIGPCLEGFGLFARSLPIILRSRHPVRAATIKTFRRLSKA